VPFGPPPGNRIVGPAVGLGGKLIRTVSFFGCGFGFGSSPAKSVPVAVPRGGRGGFMEPELAGFGSGFFIVFLKA
jgi:uncharacterized spore protein YtfJ